MSIIVFEKSTKVARILNPLKNFQEDVIAFEYRTDSLIGRNTTVIKSMLNYISKFLVVIEHLPVPRCFVCFGWLLFRER